jgi:hypothetical protein
MGLACVDSSIRAVLISNFELVIDETARVIYDATLYLPLKLQAYRRCSLFRGQKMA